jgi:DNA-binding transcriptional MocR family regulator
MAQAIMENFPSIFEFTLSKGGMFIWVKLKNEFESLAEKINMKEVLEEAKKNKVSFVPGAPFFAYATGNEAAMRLNFTNQSVENIVKAIRTIGEILQEKLKS